MMNHITRLRRENAQANDIPWAAKGKGARSCLVMDAPARQTGSLASQQSGKRLDLVPAGDDGLAAGRMEPDEDSLQVS